MRAIPLTPHGPMIEMVVNLLSVCLFLVGFGCGLYSLVPMHRAAVHHQPQIGYFKALGIFTLAFHPEHYTEAGQEARRKALRLHLLFWGLCLLGVAIGSTTGFVH